MIRAHPPFYGKRFIGDTGRKIVHDLVYEKKHLGDCRIDEIKTKHIKTFAPDNLDQVTKEGFVPCHHCLMLQ
ncbi:hypothetical protein ACFLRM_06700 [Acidobacteriota bacterium]